METWEVLAVIFTVIFVAAISFMAGILLGTNRMRKAVEEGSVGHLRIDRSVPDEPPNAFWEIVGTTIEEVSKKQFVILKVIDEDYISRD